MKLKDKISLITGSSAGIGAGLARGFAAEGADIIVNYFHDHDGAEETAEAVRKMGRQAMIMQADVGRSEDVQRMFDEIRERFGRLDILVNNAGTASMKSFSEFDEADWNRIVNTNLKSVFLCCGQAWSLMPSGGAILNISSMHSVRAMANCAVYGASKGGMEALTRALAVEFAEQGVRVNAMRPGLISTVREPCNPDMEDYEKTIERIPVGRAGSVEDLVPLAVLLCSGDGAFIDGQVVCADGGQTALLSTPYPKGFVKTGGRQRV